MQILNIRYDNITVRESLQKIDEFCSGNDKRNLFFFNADCLRQTQKDPDYCQILNSADLLLSDGIGLRLATKLFGGEMVDNCNGTDLLPKILELAANNNLKVFFLGGKDYIAEKARINAINKIPNIQIVGTHSGYFNSDEHIIKMINASKADILFVAMGVPMQEKWIHNNRNQLNAKLCFGVGAFLDYLSNSIPRAPLWMRKMSIEWFWRVLVDPKRMVKRYFIDGFGFFIWLFLHRFKKKVEQILRI